MISKSAGAAAEAAAPLRLSAAAEKGLEETPDNLKENRKSRQKCSCAGRKTNYYRAIQYAAVCKYFFIPYKISADTFNIRFP